MIHLPKRPSFNCPVCGKTVLMYCRKDDWGYGYENQLGGHVLLCSRPCMDAYAKQDFEKRVERVKKTKAFKAWLMHKQGVPCYRIAKIVGGNPSWVSTSINVLENIYWRELEWIAKQEGVAV